MTEQPHTRAPGARQPEPGPGTSALRMVLVMGAVGLVASILLVGTYRFTEPIIAANRVAYLEAALGRVLLDTDRFEAWVRVEDSWLPATNEDEGRRVFAGYSGDSLMGLAVEAAGQGYADMIRILYGYDVPCGCVVGMIVLESRETPGLGDRIETDPQFLANFEALQVTLDGGPAPVSLVKGGKTQPWEIDAISGATVSSQAITDILASSTSELVEALRLIGAPPLTVAQDSTTSGQPGEG